MDNVVLFPKVKKKNADKAGNIDAKQYRQTRMQGAVQDIANELVLKLTTQGYEIDFTEESTVRDMIFICESILAMLLRTEGQEHPFHEIIDQEMADIEVLEEGDEEDLEE